jgi:hypothetical protein
VDKLIKKTNLALVVGTHSWRDQFMEAITVSAGKRSSKWPYWETWTTPEREEHRSISRLPGPRRTLGSVFPALVIDIHLLHRVMLEEIHRVTARA